MRWNKFVCGLLFCLPFTPLLYVTFECAVVATGRLVRACCSCADSSEGLSLKDRVQCHHLHHLHRLQMAISSARALLLSRRLSNGFPSCRPPSLAPLVHTSLGPLRLD
ncbi:unnamed protein product [Protopolystoma xenopodis]|uniref:Secreted protein n=1 Tax=Protopolystoma xenopodis TaxID=117903 RepID=A0A448XFK0_9PLAT|nr:unnamed protein product [Protopolystoma xenopodis]